MKCLYIAWNDKENKAWLPVGMLMRKDGQFIFKYTKGAEQSNNFTPFGNMTDFKKIYISDNLFPLFENRLLTKSRPEFNTLMHWLDLDPADYDPLDMLALTEGRRETDSLEIFPCPENKDGFYSVSFFSHGLKYVSNLLGERLDTFKVGDPLYLSLDVQNNADKDAIILRTDDPILFAGYCPRYLVHDFNSLVEKDPYAVKVSITRINIDAPMSYRIMCTLTTSAAGDFVPCSSEVFQPIVA